MFVAGQIGWNARAGVRQRRFRRPGRAGARQHRRGAGRGRCAARAPRAPDLVRHRQARVSRRAAREVGQAYRRVIGRHFPAMTLVQVVALVEDRAKVEIEATAVVPVAGQESSAPQIDTWNATRDHCPTCHPRACPEGPRSANVKAPRDGWMVGTSPTMTIEGCTMTSKALALRQLGSTAVEDERARPRRRADRRFPLRAERGSGRATPCGAAYEAGLRYFDTSPYYGYGRSELLFGHALSSRPRDELRALDQGRPLDDAARRRRDGRRAGARADCRSSRRSTTAATARCARSSSRCCGSA